MTEGGGAPIHLFYSYSHKDEKLRNQLETHLALLRRQGLIHQWHDRRIGAGQEWAGAIDVNLESAQIILLLVSADFIASDYCYEKEMARAIERHEAGEARVIPVILRAVDWKDAPFAKLQALPKDGKPVTAWADRDAAWLDVAQGIRKAVEAVARAERQDAEEVRRYWHVPHPRNPFFTGREQTLSRLAQIFQARRQVALSGLGGMGKTQVAVEYAYRHREAYQAILWADAETVEALTSSFGALCQVLQLPERAAADQGVAVAAVSRWLARSSGWLLILDNADDLSIPRPLIPSDPQGKVLVTTRAQATGTIEPLDMTKMAAEEGALFLLRRTKCLAQDASLEHASAADRQAASALVEALDGLPLALDQAGAYIEETPSTLGEYLDLYEAEGKALRAARGELAPDHASVSATFSLAFKRLAGRSQAAADLISACACLAPNAIPEEIFTAGAAELGEAIGGAVTGPAQFAKLVREATRYSLIERQPARRTLEIHRVGRTS
ncbi:hypothetical protein BH20PSE1_BH20PSE1_14280 [soil metagenome]